MLAELVFVTRLLGLMSGPRTIEMQVDPSVHAVEVLLDGKRTTTLRGAPWRTTIDFGPELAPHELTAIARDDGGRELAVDTQLVNLPRPPAEIGVMFTRQGGKTRANIRWQHIAGRQPAKMTVKMGTRTLASVVTRSVTIPEVPPEALNVLSVDLQFDDGSSAHRDLVFGGFAEEMPAELTATLVKKRSKGRTDPARCFRSDGEPVAVSEVELGDAAVLIVRAGVPPEQLVEKTRKSAAPEGSFAVPRASVRFIWPVATGSGNSDLFLTSDVFPAMRGLRFLLTRVKGPMGLTFRLTDAVAVAGTEALREPRRRAVVLVLGREVDASRYQAATVRRYLERIGVSLHVWSLTGPVSDSAWGEVEDISSTNALLRAVARLREDLDAQRIAWLPLDPIHALHVRTVPDCAWEPLAR
jgi:hypothetical protein